MQNVAHELVVSHVSKQAMLDYPGITELLEDFGNETVTTQPGSFVEFVFMPASFTHHTYSHVDTFSVLVAHAYIHSHRVSVYLLRILDLQGMLKPEGIFTM